jgi:alanyl-tRNA synthetase
VFLIILKKREAEWAHQQTVTAERLLALEKETQQLKDKIAILSCKELAQFARVIGPISVLATKVEGLDGKSLRLAIDDLKAQLGTAIIVLASVKENKISIVGAVTANLTTQFNAKEIVNSVAMQVGGKGGGRAELAEAGGNQPESLEKALQSVYTWIEDRMKA